jgi:hypothetical protein
MKSIFKTKIDWTKLVIVSALFCLMFGFNILAQTAPEKPLDAKSLNVLVAELKGVVSSTEHDEKNAALVGEKWDRRKDLAGKTKKEVINLLYADVKSVIKDSGMLYQIYSMFSTYKQMPDESFSGQTQTPQGAPSKAEAVKQLIDLTFASHPYVGIDEQLAGLPGTKDIKDEEERVKKVRMEVFDEALKVNKKLTPDQKSFVKANYERLSKTADRIIDDTIKANFPTEQWIKEGLRQSYTAKFSTKELTSLIAYFQANTGRQVLKYIRLSKMAEMITGNGGKLDYTANDKAEYDKFASTPLGKKFLTAYITETEAYEQRKENAVRNNKPNADGFAILEPVNLNNLFNKFVAENYKK